MNTQLLLNDLKNLYESKQGADVSVKCGSEVWKVHSGIMIARSSFFAAALTGPWKESQDRAVELSEGDEVVVGAMLLYIYTCKYELEFDEQMKAMNEQGKALYWLRRAGLHVAIGLAGDEFGNAGLQQFATNAASACIDLAQEHSKKF